jgi:hypothetical protein
MFKSIRNVFINNKKYDLNFRLGLFVLFYVENDPTKIHISLSELNLSRPKHFM